MTGRDGTLGWTSPSPPGPWWPATARASSPRWLWRGRRSGTRNCTTPGVTSCSSQRDSPGWWSPPAQSGGRTQLRCGTSGTSRARTPPWPSSTTTRKSTAHTSPFSRGTNCWRQIIMSWGSTRPRTSLWCGPSNTLLDTTASFPWRPTGTRLLTLSSPAAPNPSLRRERGGPSTSSVRTAGSSCTASSCLASPRPPLCPSSTAPGKGWCQASWLISSSGRHDLERRSEAMWSFQCSVFKINNVKYSNSELLNKSFHHFKSLQFWTWTCTVLRCDGEQNSKSIYSNLKKMSVKNLFNFHLILADRHYIRQG